MKSSTTRTLKPLCQIIWHVATRHGCKFFKKEKRKRKRKRNFPHWKNQPIVCFPKFPLIETPHLSDVYRQMKLALSDLLFSSAWSGVKLCDFGDCLLLQTPVNESRRRQLGVERSDDRILKCCFQLKRKWSELLFWHIDVDFDQEFYCFISASLQRPASSQVLLCTNDKNLLRNVRTSDILATDVQVNIVI